MTNGKPKVIAVQSLSESYTEQDIYALAAAAEQFSEHPLGKAIVGCYKQNTNAPIPKATDFEMRLGQGVCAVVDGKRIFAGKLGMANGKKNTYQTNPEIQGFSNDGSTITYLVSEDEMIGYIV